MGFGFNLGVIFIVIPATGFLILLWFYTKKKTFGIILLSMWLMIIGFAILSSAINWVTSKKKVSKNDIYGDYIIDRSKFSGKQADWQYNHFQFKITKNDSVYFYETDGDKIIKAHKGRVKFLEQYIQPRIVFEFKYPKHHIIEDNPTLYRTTWSFYYVFMSSKFDNVFFKKGKWEAITK